MKPRALVEDNVSGVEYEIRRLKRRLLCQGVTRNRFIRVPTLGPTGWEPDNSLAGWKDLQPTITSPPPPEQARVCPYIFDYDAPLTPKDTEGDEPVGFHEFSQRNFHQWAEVKFNGGAWRKCSDDQFWHWWDHYEKTVTGAWARCQNGAGQETCYELDDGERTFDFPDPPPVDCP